MESDSLRFSPSDRLDNDDPSQSSRSLFDLIQNDESGTAYRDLISSKSGNKSRKSLNDRSRLSRSSSTRSQVPASDISFGSRRFQPSATCPDDDYVVECDEEVCVRIPRLQSALRHPSGRNAVENPDEQGSEVGPYSDLSSSSGREFGGGGGLQRSSSKAMSRTANAAVEEEEEENEQKLAEPPKMSLMALLEEVDRQAGVGPTYFGFGAGEGEDEEEEEEEQNDGVEHVCGVCMVLHKGAALAPCGHTLCRLCSKELWVSGGSCPLCDAYIMEILVIF